MSLGDVDHDGWDDLSFCNDNGGVEVWRWVGPETWQDLSGSLPLSGPFEASQLFDMDMDGHLDVAAFGGGQARIWGGDGAGGWTEIAAFTTPSPGYMAAFRVGGDADHNGYPDIVLVAEQGSWPSYKNYARFFKETSEPASLEILPVYPHGQETFHAGAVVFVDWLSAVPGGEVGSVNLELSTEGPSGPWQPIAVDLADGGRYQWRISPETPSTEEAYIRHTLMLGPDVAQTLSPAPFSIAGPPDEPIEGLEPINDSPTALGQPTAFTATVASGTNVQYEWAFGDGGHDEGAQVTHVYTALGAHTAVVTASNSVSLLTATTPVTITDEPIAGLMALNDSPTPLGSSTALTATVAAGTNVSYTWSFGDGAFGGGSDVDHTYPAVGPFTAVVSALNSVGQQTATTLVTITDVPIEGLQAANNSPTPLGNDTELTASVEAGTNLSYAWAFGDGIEASGATVSHVYPDTGSFTATVTASNSLGEQTTTTMVAISDVPIAGLCAANDSPTPLGSTTLLTATIEAGTNVTYTWTFGDGTLGSGAIAAYLYPETGLYTAVVIASNSLGDVGAATWVTITAAFFPLYLPVVARLLP